MAEARFQAAIGGSIFFRWLSTDRRNTLITTQLFHNHNATETTTHSWKIFVTDIFEASAERSQINCNKLQTIYDPQNLGKNHGKSPGDIDIRVGEIKIAKSQQQKTEQQLFQDNELILIPSDLSGSHRQLFVVIYDHHYRNQFLDCAKIRNVHKRVAK